MSERKIKNTEPPEVVPQSASQLTRRDLLVAGLGALGLAAFGVGAGFVSKQLFPQRLVYKFPDTAVAQGDELTPTPACPDDHDAPTATFEEGPYYVPDTPLRSNFRLPGYSGRELVLRGRVLDTRCQPLAGAVLDFWQVNEQGLYDNINYNYRGHQFTRADGSYKLLTLLPVSYSFLGLWRAPHIHVKVQGKTTPLLTTQIFFDHDPESNARAFDFDHAIMGKAQSLPDGSAETIYNFVLEAV